MIHYLSRNDTDHTVIFSVGGVRYEYWLTPYHCTQVDYIARHISSGKAFAYAKRWASRCDRIVIPVASL